MAVQKKKRKAEPDSQNAKEALKWVLRLMPVALLLVSAAVGFQQVENVLIEDPCFRLGAGDEYEGVTADVQVRGVVNASLDRIEQVFEEDAGRSLYLLPIEERRRRLLAVDWVRDASVARVWPNRVEVFIREREPVAFVHVESKRSSVMLIDADGVLLKPPPRSEYTLPVLRGISEALSEQKRALRVRRAVELMEAVGPLAQEVSEVDVSDAKNLMVSLRVAGNGVLLMVGRENFRRRIDNFIAHYPEIQRRLPAATTFDLRLDDRITAVDGVEDKG
jgi:cell division protein FtsQ